MDYMDSNKIGQRIENKLIHALGRTISEATNDEIYKAAAELRNFTICQPNF